LASDDAGLASAVESYLRNTLGQTPRVCTFTSLRAHLGPEADGLLVATAASAADAKQIIRLVQDIVLQKWPPIIVVLAGRRAVQTGGLVGLEPYVAHQWRWPQDAALLAGLVKKHLACGRAFPPAEAKSVVELVGRRLLGWTPSLLSLVDRLAVAAAHDVTVLLTGETGTGKSHLARLIHECSRRKAHRFLVVPCGALAANLIESELFGHVKGAFTGADRVKVGKFAAAGHGTLLLDEIDALSLEQQANLLRVFETGEYEAVGSNETRLCTARLIVASNCNLEEAVDRGQFRRDLYYRLNVMPFELPPLRERAQDIGPLVRGMAARFNQKFQKELFDIHADAMRAMQTFPWPGNIRQLENVVQQAVVVSRGPQLLLHHLPQVVQEVAALYLSEAREAGDSLSQRCETSEKSLIMRALVGSGFNRARAASALGISRVTLYKRLKKYGLMEAPLSGERADRPGQSA
jgi:DNA-binding NtrC family response regulator